MQVGVIQRDTPVFVRFIAIVRPESGVAQQAQSTKCQYARGGSHA